MAKGIKKVSPASMARSLFKASTEAAKAGQCSSSRKLFETASGMGYKPPKAAKSAQKSCRVSKAKKSSSRRGFGMLLKKFTLFSEPKTPRAGRDLLRREFKNKYGTVIEVTLRENRKGDAWWLSSTYKGGMRASNTMVTRSAEKAESWRKAVEKGDIQWDRDDED